MAGEKCSETPGSFSPRWAPTATMVLASATSGSTIGNSFGVRGAAGWRVMDRFWAGPEVETSGDVVYRQYRIGAHLTSFKMSAFEWSLGAGYVQDNSHRSGVYGRIGVYSDRSGRCRDGMVQQCGRLVGVRSNIRWNIQRMPVSPYLRAYA